MSDTPMLELLAYVMRDPEWAASEITILQRELAAANKRIAELEQLIPLVKEVMSNHRDPQSGEYNECESSPCMWCDIAQKAIDAARVKETNNAP